MAEFCPYVIPSYSPDGESEVNATCKATGQSIDNSDQQPKYKRCAGCPVVEYKLTDQYCRLIVTKERFSEVTSDKKI